VETAVADAACRHLNENFVFLRRLKVDVFDFEGLAGFVKNGCDHVGPP
jgi:hypothetical protein